MPSHVPEVPVSRHTRSNSIADDVDFEIKGAEMQFVEVELDPGESAVAEAGAMMFKSSSITMNAVFGDGSNQDGGFMGKLLGAGKRLITGESLFTTVFTHEASARRVSPSQHRFRAIFLPSNSPTMAGASFARRIASLPPHAVYRLVFICSAKS